MQNFTNLKVWDKAHQAVLAIYRYTKAFPSEELYGLTSQLRRAGISIPANIAEGCGKLTDKDFARYLYISLGSAHEVQYYLILSRDLEYLKETEFSELNIKLQEVKGMLIALIKKVQSSALSPKH